METQNKAAAQVTLLATTRAWTAAIKATGYKNTPRTNKLKLRKEAAEVAYAQASGIAQQK